METEFHGTVCNGRGGGGGSSMILHHRSPIQSISMSSVSLVWSLPPGCVIRISYACKYVPAHFLGPVRKVGVGGGIAL